MIDDITRCKDTDLGGFPVWSILLGSDIIFIILSKEVKYYFADFVCKGEGGTPQIRNL